MPVPSLHLVRPEEHAAKAELPDAAARLEATGPNELEAAEPVSLPRLIVGAVTEPFVLHNGRLRVPEGPGLGVTPLPDVLENVTTSVEVVRAP